MKRKPYTEPRYWLGVDPTNCDTCGGHLLLAFIDGATTRGPWAIMCPSCWRNGPGLGYPLGEGRGQKYRKQPDGRWLKVEG